MSQEMTNKITQLNEVWMEELETVNEALWNLDGVGQVYEQVFFDIVRRRTTQLLEFYQVDMINSSEFHSLLTIWKMSVVEGSSAYVALEELEKKVPTDNLVLFPFR